MRYLVLAAVTISAPLSARATAAQLTRCAAITSDLRRLACFDTLAKPQRQPAVTPVPTRPSTGLVIPDAPLNPHPGKVSSSFDRFDRRSKAELVDLKVGGGFEFNAFFSVDGELLKPPLLISVMLSSSAKEWEYLQCNSLSVLVDGKPFDVGTVKHDGRVGTGYVIEFIEFNLSPAQLLDLARAKLIEGRVCRTEFKLGPPEILALQHLASFMK